MYYQSWANRNRVRLSFYTDSPYGPKENKGEVKSKGIGPTIISTHIKDKWGNKNKNREALNNNLPQIRGRKYYWHKEVEMSEFKDNKVSPMRQRIRPMKPNGGVRPTANVSVSVYYEQLGKKAIGTIKMGLLILVVQNVPTKSEEGNHWDSEVSRL